MEPEDSFIVVLTGVRDQFLPRAHVILMKPPVPNLHAEGSAVWDC
jgi:hypothetical protein